MRLLIGGSISKILNNYQLAKEMGENGRKFVSQKFNWDKIGSEIISLIKDYKIKN